MERGLNAEGYKVCKFLFKVGVATCASRTAADCGATRGFQQRIPGQPPLPVYTDENEDADADADAEQDPASEADATAAEDNDDQTETVVNSEA